MFIKKVCNTALTDRDAIYEFDMLRNSFREGTFWKLVQRFLNDHKNICRETSTKTQSIFNLKFSVKRTNSSENSEKSQYTLR